MSRPLRIEFEGAWYHVMNRGAGRRTIFRAVADRRGFLDLLGSLSETFGVETHAYCLMDNHYHLLLHTPRGNLGAAMRHLGSVFTQRANRLATTDGPLFRGRYKAILVDADGYLAQVSRYIHRNPVEAGLAKDPGDYRWSSFPAYLALAAAPRWLVVEQVLELFDAGGARRRYAEFVRQDVDVETAAFYGAGRSAPVLGSAAFRARIERELPSQKDRTELPARRALGEAPDIARIVDATAREFSVPVSQITGTVRGRGRRNVARSVAIGLCRTLGGHPLSEIADAFAIGHYASVSNVVRRFLMLCADDAALTERVERVKARLGE